MKRIIQTTATLVFLACSLVMIHAQQNDYQFSDRKAGYWIFGLNGGWAYQQGDVPISPGGFGVGLTLGKNLIYQPNSFSFDLRGRALYAQTFGLSDAFSSGIQNNTALNGTNGLDYTAAPGLVFHNNKTTVGELALEGVINFDGLRQKNNVHLAIFGGVGLDYYNTMIDQKNGSDLYDYSAVTQSSTIPNIKTHLKDNVLDGNYETAADGFADGGTIDVMPSLGLELGYWFTPKFAATLGHRTTWTRTDVFDGQQWDDNNMLTGDNDLYHYTSLGLKWIIEPGRTGSSRSPIINVMQPYGSPFTSTTSTSVVRANIKNVNSAMDLELLVNGVSTRFDYFDKQLSSVLNLNPGRNTIVIKATNSGGSAQENVVIFYKEEEIIAPPPPPVVEARYPEVNITSPSGQNYISQSERITIEANIKEVPNRNDVNFYINDNRSTDFNYNNRTGRFSANVNLEEGRNDIRIVVGNNAGRATDEVVVDYQREVRAQRPRVRITTPNSSPFRTESSRATVMADVDGVERKSDIRFSVNGRTTTNFSFNSFNDQVSADINLSEGRNTIVISARNDGGEDQDEVTIEYENYVTSTPRVDPPSVKITSVSEPQSNPYRPNECTTNVTATVRNVESKQDINFLVNGSRYTNFSFDTRRNIVRAEVRLTRERNEIIIQGRNASGNNQDRTFADCYSRPVVEAPVVSITSVSEPRSNPYRPNECTTTVTATVLNVDSKQDINFTINGSRNTNFSFDTRRKVFRAEVKLTRERNELLVQARNEGGNHQDRAAAECQTRPVVAPPKVSITSPSNNSKAMRRTTSVRATVQNVENPRDITLTINGRNKADFNFDRRSKVLTTTFNLVDGKNTVSIRARNEAGEDQASVNVQFQGIVSSPRMQPTVSITNPRSDLTVENKSMQLRASTKNVSRKSDVSLSINGRSTTNFNYSPITKEITTTLSLNEGRNTINIIVKNRDGSAQDKRTITYKKAAPALAKPIVNITSPVGRRKIFSQAKTTVKATIQNVAATKDVSFFLNGKRETKFKFDPKAKTFSADIILKSGSNTVRIEGKNASGTGSKEMGMTYRPRIATTKNDTDSSGPTRTKNNDILKPTIKITSIGQPTINPFSPNSAKSTVLAKITSVSKKENIVLTVNGKVSTDFTYNNKTGDFQAIISLKRGKNTFTIKATNSLGAVDITEEITY